MEKENICISNGIKNADLSLHYIWVWSAGLSNIDISNIDNTTSVNREKVYLVFVFSCSLYGKVF